MQLFPALRTASCVQLHLKCLHNSLFSAGNANHTKLTVVHIFFGTATYDEVEDDVKVTLEAQLGLIGGTMGLLTGFSILSGVEIIYYGLKLFMGLNTSRAAYNLNQKAN